MGLPEAKSRRARLDAAQREWEQNELRNREAACGESPAHAS